MPFVMVDPGQSWAEHKLAAGTALVIVERRWTAKVPRHLARRLDERALAWGGAVVGAHEQEVALAAGWSRLVLATVDLVSAGRHVGDQLDEGGGLDGAGGAGEADDPAGDLLEVRQADAVLEVAVAEADHALVRVERALFEEGGEGGVEVDDDLVDGAAVVDAPGLCLRNSSRSKSGGANVPSSSSASAMRSRRKARSSRRRWQCPTRYQAFSRWKTLYGSRPRHAVLPLHRER